MLFNNEFYINDSLLKKVNNIEYLGFSLNSNLEFNFSTLEKFKQVQKTFFSASFLLDRLNNLTPTLKSYLYKTFCLSKFTYGLENTPLDIKTLKTLNIYQNNLIRQMLKLKYNCHMSNILKVLKVFKIDQLYIFSKLSFISTIKFNTLANKIFNSICGNIIHNHPSSPVSFETDVKRILQHFDTNLHYLLSNVNQLKLNMKAQLSTRDGISDSIEVCLNNIRFKNYRNILNDLIKPR